MKDTFRITFKRVKWGEYQAQLVDAETATDACRMIHPYWSIRSISMQCRGKTGADEPCQRFTSQPYCCSAHKPDWPEQEPIDRYGNSLPPLP